MRNFFKILFGFVLAGLFLSIVLSIILSIFGAKDTQVDGFFVIKRGDNVFQIAGNLKQQGYISNQLAFVYSATVSENFRKMNYNITKE